MSRKKEGRKYPKVVVKCCCLWEVTRGVDDIIDCVMGTKYLTGGMVLAQSRRSIKILPSFSLLIPRPLGLREVH